MRPICDDVRQPRGRRRARAHRPVRRRRRAIGAGTGRRDRGCRGDARPPTLRAALEEAIDRTRRVHQAQRREDVTVEVVPGGTVTERWVPVGRVGLYVPGGVCVYPSSVVMNVVPAQVAGVELARGRVAPAA